MNPWITVTTAAKILGLSRPTVWKRIRTGELSVMGYVDGRIAVLDRAYIEREAQRRRNQKAA